MKSNHVTWTLSVLLPILTAPVSRGTDWYISRASGDDSWSCNRIKPCKHIWKAVTLATSKDYIYLDGTNTENDPYTCQSETAAHQGININKSLSLVGFGPKPPHIRCSEGLTFDGSDDAQHMHITLSGLFLDESLVYFQDCFVNIDRCKFQDSKRGVQFSVNTTMVSIIQITDSAFVNNSGCISVVVNKTVKLSQDVLVTFTLKNSSFQGNAMSDEGSCVSFSELSDNKDSVSLNITLENAEFSDNKFSAKGLVFLDMENGNQDINLQKVKFIKNSALSRPNVYANGDHSELIVNSNSVNIFVNESSFSSTNARSFFVKATSISMDIFNSSFGGNTCEGNGGVIFMNGFDLCKVKVSNSSFVKTSSSQGGAFNIECTEVRFNLLESIFLHNNATDGNGGAVLISGYRVSVRFLNSSFTNSLAHWVSQAYGGALFVTSMVPPFHSSIFQANHSDNILFLTVERCRFIGCRSEHGGSLYVEHSNHLQLVIKHSDFIFNYAYDDAAALSTNYKQTEVMTDDCRTRKTCIVETSIENSTFSRNEGGVLSLYGSGNLNMPCSDIIFTKVIMDSNSAKGYTAFIRGACKVKISQSRLLNNRAVFGASGIGIRDVISIEVADSIFDGNYVWKDTQVIRPGGGALTLLNYEFDHLYYDSAFVFILNSTFNNSGGGGGAILLQSYEPIHLTINSSTFNNCSASRGGALHVQSYEHIHLTINSSRFTKNLSDKGGGATWLSLTEDTAKIPEKCNDDYWPSWHYKSHVIFEDTTFEGNTAGEVGGAVYISNGNITISRSHFVDNFASLGSHIYTVDGSTSLKIQNSRFSHIAKESTRSTLNSKNPTFIDFESGGPVVLYNTSLNASPYRNKITLIVVAKSKLTFFRKENLTNFSCPLGSQMTNTNFTTKITSQRNIFNRSCKISMQYTGYHCLACESDTYSLLRGHAIEGEIVPGFQCFQCPFGANCTQNIFAKPNFWGFQEQNNPPTLQFTMCPTGYCSPPQGANFPVYNGCQGNRSGELCGHCHEGYTETLYSTNCRPSNQCKDYWFWPVALFYVSLMAMYFIFTPPIVPWIKRQTLWFKENRPVNQDYNFDKGYLKILFYFYQAANLVIVSSSSQHVIKINLIDPIVGFFNFKSYSLGFVCPFPGLTVVSKQFFSASHVFCTMLMVCFCYVLHCGIQRLRGEGAPFVGSYVGAILQTLLLGYTTLATVSFSLLRCVLIGSEKRLFYDGNHVCFQWWQYILVGFACTFVIPFVFVLLWGSYKLYGKTLSTGKFLLACFFPLPSLIYWLFISFCRVLRNPVNDVSTPHQMSVNSVERVLYDSFKRPDEGGKLTLGWEGIMIGRRLILVVLKTFVNSPMPRLLIMSLFCFLFLLHHIVAQPFRDSLANTAETISLLSIAILGMVNLFYASFLSLAVSFNDYFSSWWNVCEGVEVVILCLVPAVFGLLVVIAILSQFCRLAVLVCRLLYNVCWICFRSRYSNQSDEPKPLLAPVH